MHTVPVFRPCNRAALYQADCRTVLPALPNASVDLVLTDPPYPCIKRGYGTWTETEWWEMMRVVVPEVRRVLNPKGSAVFVLQPNSEKMGRMRPWLWEFMAWVCHDWNMVQDAYWWNPKAIPEAHAIQGRLLRPSVKACIWAGEPDCWRNQEAVLWTESQHTEARRRMERASGRQNVRHNSPGGQGINTLTRCDAAERRGGVCPFNLIPADHGYAQRSAGSHNHGAGTPLSLCSWWIRYLCPPGGVVLDPFAGSSTVGVASLQYGNSFIGIEQVPEYVEVSRKRLADTVGPLFATSSDAVG